MATFRSSQCQDGDEVLKCSEDVRAQKDALEILNTRKSTSRRILRCILSKNFENSEFWWGYVLVVSLRGVNFGFWSHLECSRKNAIIFSREGLV